MTRPRHPGFERALFEDPDDRAAWAVYADWLSEQGHPIGELIALELEVEAAVAAGDRPAPTLAARYAALAHDGPLRWATPALARSDELLTLEWRRAAPYLARIVASSSSEATAALERLVPRAGPAAHDHGRFLVGLHLDLALARDDRGWLPATPWSASGPGPALPSLRSLELVARAALDRRLPALDLRFDWATALPRLRSLALRAPGLRCEAPHHPGLRCLLLSMRGGFELALVEALAAARFPALERLHLWLGRIAEDQRNEALRSFDRLLDNPQLGPIRELALNGSTLPPMSLAHLAGSTLARGLEGLQLRCGTIGDEHLPALRALIGAAERLRELDLSRNYLSAAALAQLQGGFAGRLIGDQQKPDGDRHIPVFGHYGVFDGISPQP